MAESIPILKNILVISDGCPGHENQSIGLAEALRLRCNAHLEIVRISPRANLIKRTRQALSTASVSSLPGLIIAAGHKCHIPLLLAASRYKAKSVLIMKPTLPCFLFDLCIIPRHDYKDPPLRNNNIILTQGALNRIPEKRTTKTATGIILIGGPSRHYACNEDSLIPAISSIIQKNPQLTWTITNSRRTPPDLLRKIASMDIRAKIVSHQTTPAEWVPQQLIAASQVWVTEDSVTMISEAITSGAHVGLLPMPPKSSRGRLVRAIQGILNNHLATPYSSWIETQQLYPPGEFHESARCANLILQRFYRQNALREASHFEKNNLCQETPYSNSWNPSIKNGNHF